MTGIGTQVRLTSGSWAGQLGVVIEVSSHDADTVACVTGPLGADEPVWSLHLTARDFEPVCEALPVMLSAANEERDAALALASEHARRVADLTGRVRELETGMRELAAEMRSIGSSARARCDRLVEIATALADAPAFDPG